MNVKKNGLIMEGGGMRGLFTCGVIDIFMENGVKFDGAIGVSAGALFGSNYKSHQIGRGLRYNKRFCKDYRYGTLRSLVRTGDLFDVDFCYRVIPEELDIFDSETYKNDPMEFYVVCTDADTGKPVYNLCMDGSSTDIKWMRASGSMPMVSKPVELSGRRLLDGGIADPIPIKHFEELGYNHNVVILTQQKGYKKKKNSLSPFLNILMGKYPEIAKAMSVRHDVYNETIEYIEKLESEGSLFVIRPPESLNIGRTEKNPSELERVYQIGHKTAKECLSDVTDFLKKH